MTLTAWLVFIIAALLCLLWQQAVRTAELRRRYTTTCALVDELTEGLVEIRGFAAELQRHTLVGEQYDPEKDPTRQPHHEHAIAEALVELTDADTIDEPAPLLDEQRPDTAPTRVPTPEELAAASRGVLLDKRPVEPHVPEFIEERQP
jgi:hypothetical protein